MKTILSVWHTGNRGKTETLREFATLLLNTYPSKRLIIPTTGRVPDYGDFRLVLEINGKL